MTREEAESLNIGDMVYIPERGKRDWPESYDRIIGNMYQVVSIDSDTITVKDGDHRFHLYFEEIMRAVPEDLGDDFVSSDIKLLFGGDG